MKTYTEYLVVETSKRYDFLNITEDVNDIIRKSGVDDGLVLVNPMHITAAVYVNDAESGLLADYREWLEELAPAKPDYKHHQTGEDNADAHLKRTLMGHQVTMSVAKGELELGTWEQIYYAEFDGQRKKRILVKVIGI
jgi:secondary thiamine-phosphate synthase enzyme